MTRFLLIIFIICLALIAFAIVAQGECGEVPDNMWQIVMAESVGEGEIGMKAVCCVVRNRLATGLSMGLSGARRKDLGTFCQRQGVRYQDMAKRVVREVFENNCKDITFGATHFESTNYPVPYWARNMQIVFKHKKHIFYRKH